MGMIVLTPETKDTLKKTRNAAILALKEIDKQLLEPSISENDAESLIKMNRIIIKRLKQVEKKLNK